METSTTSNIADFGVNTNITIDDWLIIKLIGAGLFLIVFFFTIRALASE